MPAPTAHRSKAAAAPPTGAQLPIDDTRIREIITAPRVRQWMQRVTGVVLLGFGARLALERV